MARGQPQIQLNGAMIVFPGLKISPLGTRTSRPTESQITVKESKKILPGNYQGSQWEKPPLPPLLGSWTCAFWQCLSPGMVVLAEGLQAKKTNPYPEHVSVPVRTGRCPHIPVLLQTRDYCFACQGATLPLEKRPLLAFPKICVHEHPLLIGIYPCWFLTAFGSPFFSFYLRSCRYLLVSLMVLFVVLLLIPLVLLQDFSRGVEKNGNFTVVFNTEIW